MNSKFFSALAIAVVALVASSSQSFAVTYTPAQFNAALKTTIGKKTGSAAYNAAANFYSKALTDKKNTKNAATYAKYVVTALKKVVKDPQKGASTNTLVKALLKGYFRTVKFNLSDAIYNKALDAILKGLPGSQKTSITSQSIYTSIKTYASGKGVSQSAVYQYYTGVAQKFLIPPPPVS